MGCEGIEYLNFHFHNRYSVFKNVYCTSFVIPNPRKDLGKHDREFQTEPMHKMMENRTVFTDEIPEHLNWIESSNVIDFTSGNTEDMMNTRYREFNKYLAWWTYIPQARRS